MTRNDQRLLRLFLGMLSHSRGVLNFMLRQANSFDSDEIRSDMLRAANLADEYVDNLHYVLGRCMQTYRNPPRQPKRKQPTETGEI